MKKICFLGSMLLSWCIVCGLLPAAAADNPPIRIGATVSLEGPYAEPSMMIRDAFRLWEQEVNQNGGLLGRKVKLILIAHHGVLDPDVHFIQKPFTVNDLLAKVRETLEA